MHDIPKTAIFIPKQSNAVDTLSFIPVHYNTAVEIVGFTLTFPYAQCNL